MQMSINENIKRIRQKKGLSQYDFAKRTKKLNQSQISKIENGNRSISTGDLIYIAEALNVSVDELIKEKE